MGGLLGRFCVYGVLTVVVSAHFDAKSQHFRQLFACRCVLCDVDVEADATAAAAAVASALTAMVRS